jgi:hypothetical protein
MASNYKPEPRIADLLSEDITHLLMRADGIGPSDVTALVASVYAKREPRLQSADGDNHKIYKGEKLA